MSYYEQQIRNENKFNYFHLIILVVMLFFGCGRGIFVSENKAVDALETNGFSNIEIKNTKYLWIPLSGGDASDCVRFEAEAKNPAGEIVTVYVFSGWPFKGATIRTP